MTADTALHRGRESFRGRAWTEACAQLTAADHQSPLQVDDLETLAVAAYLVGDDANSTDVWTRAHHERLNAGDAPRAARCAFWLAFALLNKGELARSSGWVARARRLLDEGRHDCVERGYLLWPAALEHMFSGDAAAAHATFGEATKIGERFADTDLVVLARHGQGRALIHLGETARGVALLDEAMVAITAGEVSPIVVGDVYCSVIEACWEIFDVRRAQEWTSALSRWCDSQSDSVVYRGQCLVHRAEIMQLHGAWPDALEEIHLACERLSHPAHPAIGAALYQQAELHRLRGEFASAEKAYRQASQRGREPQPGLAQLRLAQGQVEAAATAIRRAVDEGHDRATRARVLAAGVEILLALRDLDAARAAANELSTIAGDLDATFLRALSATATGALLIAENDARQALDVLRRAWASWRDLDAPYEAARVRVLVALACRALGDEDGAEMELDAARATFELLGAAVDLARVQALLRTTELPARDGLTGREVQVLTLVATGRTNRAIAGELFISEKTVARHVSNIFTKLGLSSRAAATAYAYEHGFRQSPA